TTVHTGPYTAVRLVALTLLNQRWKPKRFEVRIGERDRERFGSGPMPGASSTPGGVPRQLFPHPQCDQRRLTAAWCFPLPPQRSPKTQPNPTGEGFQHSWGFTEAEITSPTPHLRSQFCYRRLSADALRPSRNLSNVALEPLPSLRRNCALHLRAAREADPE